MDSDFLKLVKLTNEDTVYLESVMIDIRSYINALHKTEHKRKVLLFPPVNNFRRFLIHHLVDTTFRKEQLNTLSIGSLYARRTVVYPSSLKPMEAKPMIPASPKKNDNEKKITEIPLYRPPALRKSVDNIQTRDKERKARKPDIQIYVPRGRRLLASQENRTEEKESIKSTEGINELKSPGISKKASLVDKSNNPSDSDRTVVSLELSPESIIEIPVKKLKGTGELKENSTNTEEIVFISEDKTNSDTDFDLPDREINESNCNNDEIKLIDLTCDEEPEKIGSLEDSKIIDKSYGRDSISLNENENNSYDSTVHNESLDDERILKLDTPSSDSHVEINSKERGTNSDDDIQVVLDDVLQTSTITASSKADQTKIHENNLLKNSTLEVSSPNTLPPIPNQKNTLLNVNDCDWEELFDDNGDYVDESLINELMTAIGKTSIQHAAQNYTPFQTVEERTSDGGCIIEVHGFPAEFKTDDLFSIFAPFRVDKAFQIVWVDDTHALAVFSSPVIADEVLNTELPFVKTRPLKNAIPKSRMKAQDYISPPATRPKTCVSLARRLVSGHLGMKIKVTDKQKEEERRLLSDAREKRRLVAKQKQDAWDGNLDDGKLS